MELGTLSRVYYEVKVEGCIDSADDYRRIFDGYPAALGDFERACARIGAAWEAVGCPQLDAHVTLFVHVLGDDGTDAVRGTVREMLWDI